MEIASVREFADCQTKQSLVYDLQEPFRWISDVAVVEAFESGVLDLPNFYFTGDDYRYRFEIEAKRRFLDLLRERFNAAVKYNGHLLKWDRIIELKTAELGRYLNGKTEVMSFLEPMSRFERRDSLELRARIFALTSHEAKQRGIEKNTLHYLLKKARNDRPFMIYRKVRSKLALDANLGD